ncbi:MAG: hypothetical protein ACXADB_08930 [Candidatus Hermodarchaeia archaeon]|jgi:hypothetical protein
MGKSNTWKKKQIASTFGAFGGQFGEMTDLNRVVLEIILEELHGQRKRLSIFGEKEQTRTADVNRLAEKQEDPSDESY